MKGHLVQLVRVFAPLYFPGIAIVAEGRYPCREISILGYGIGQIPVQGKKGKNAGGKTPVPKFVTLGNSLKILTLGNSLVRVFAP